MLGVIEERLMKTLFATCPGTNEVFGGSPATIERVASNSHITARTALVARLGGA